VKFRASTERFHSQFDWLDSWHSFSFSHHYDPSWMGFGPLRVINDDTVAAGRGFGMHPHQDMEIVTVMVQGQLNHRDSMGHSEVLKAGEVQRMSAGTGVVHSEMNLGQEACRFLQIWIEPDQRDLKPDYEQKPFGIGRDWTALLDPSGRDAAMAISQTLFLWRAKPQSGDELSLPAEGGPMLWMQLIDGALSWTSEQGEPATLVKGDGVGLHRDDPRLQRLKGTDSGADVLLFAMNA
jgi:redox-sensitive bicupin YhaK (pirin superfamily)